MEEQVYILLEKLNQEKQGVLNSKYYKKVEIFEN